MRPSGPGLLPGRSAFASAWAGPHPAVGMKRGMRGEGGEGELALGKTGRNCRGTGAGGGQEAAPGPAPMTCRWDVSYQQQRHRNFRNGSCAQPCSFNQRHTCHDRHSTAPISCGLICHARMACSLRNEYRTRHVQLGSEHFSVINLLPVCLYSCSPMQPTHT